MNWVYSCKLVERVYANARFKLERMVHESSQDLILIKTISSQLSSIETEQTLNQEYALLSKFDTESIIKSRGLKKHENKLILILENFAGQSLVRFLETSSISLSAFLTIALQLVEAVQAIHRQGIIHRNLQPGCILINPQSLELKIIDFSWAINMDSSTIVVSGLLPDLNILYIAPEQTGRMNISLDRRADFYSLGILLYQIATGVLPYQIEDSLELLHAHLAQAPLSPHYIDDHLPLVISSLIMKLL
ncbi:MAG: serine/threonine protein kinase, partial [Waterburya sp.]